MSSLVLNKCVSVDMALQHANELHKNIADILAPIHTGLGLNHIK